MDGFSSDDAVDFSPPKKSIGKTVMKWIVVTKKKFVSAPRGSMWGDMKTSGEARYIGINTLWTAEMLMDQLRAVFPCLQSKERNQIRVFRTTSRGNIFTRLSEYLPNAKELLQLFKGTKSPRIYLYMKNSKGMINIFMNMCDVKKTMDFDIHIYISLIYISVTLISNTAING
ncbi:uncharacterized protein LOC116292538, partial [Actinia tenebrosa]|uniref:Uncharacterized protein LOC116292538 n=1 Tax=Actinia tenebrosa TaxID=6105 RepID=A0A6P8HST4_ACTTE